MSNIVFSRSIRNLRARYFTFPVLYPTPCGVRAASLNSAIGRGLRRSKGVGFRGKERIRTDDANNSSRASDGPVRRTAESVGLSSSQSQMTRGGWEGKSKDGEKRPPRSSAAPSKGRIRVGKRVVKSEEERRRPKKRSRAARFHDPNYSFGKKSKFNKSIDVTTQASRSRRSDFEPSRNSRESDLPFFGKRRGAGELRQSRSEYIPPTSEDISNARSWDRPDQTFSFSPRDREKSANLKDSYLPVPNKPRPWEPNDKERYTSASGGPRSGQYQLKLQERSVNSSDRYSLSSSGTMSASIRERNDESSTSRPRFSQTLESRLPISVPYTTPASEFLYGTAVVEAALTSRRIPRRKLYKLYIYKGENRAETDRDDDLERLAKQNGVGVVHVTGDMIRLLDKMSGGRPHNGYILEASPLPMLPVTSLGEFISGRGQAGFKVALDHQSREDVAINGTSNFIRVSNTNRKPFVLLLDSILDPGNLGGIIRTASFLGVDGIAISSRNSASFTPVVLKASAGASENITLFSVNKPAGFIADSKSAGWKVFAAVAPSGTRSSSVRMSVSTDNLGDPLSQDPCILMIGSEGEGLRGNLKSKADADLSIRGSGQSYNVDSLNVSVATGILCNSFLKRNYSRTSPPLVQVESEAADGVKSARDLF